MHKEAAKLSDKLVWILTVFLVASFLLFDTYTWGKFAFLAVSVCILIISVINDGGRLFVRIDAYQWMFAAFMLFTLFTSLWAIRSTDSIVMARTLFRILVCFTFLYWYYVKQDNISSLLSALKWGGYFIAYYSIVFYGFDFLLSSTLSASMRLENEFANVNSIGMAVAMSLFLQVCEWAYGRFRLWTLIPFIPTVIVVAASQSRKAMVFCIVGVFIVFIIKNIGKKKVLNLLKLVIGILLIIAIIYVLAKLSIFTGISERFETLYNSLTGEGKADSSSIIRSSMNKLGIEWWKKYPIAGIGMSNTHIIAAQELNFDAYLHNNYVELLCGGGVIGFLLYYAMHAYLAFSLLKYRKVDEKYFAICFSWLIIMLIMDYGRVSYSSKMQWFYLMVQFVNVECLKHKYKEKFNES